AAGAEVAVEAAVAVQPRHGELGAGVVAGGGPGQDDVPRGVEGHARSGIDVALAEVGEDDRAAGAEVAVQAAVAVEPGHGECTGIVDKAGTGQKDVAGGVQGHARRRVVGGRGGELEEDLAAGAETAVQAAVGVVADHGDPVPSTPEVIVTAAGDD